MPASVFYLLHTPKLAGLDFSVPRTLFPDGLPPSYVFVATLRYKGSVTKEEWDVWRIQTRDGKPQMAVTLNGVDRAVMFTTTSKAPSGTQTVTFKHHTSRVKTLLILFTFKHSPSLRH